MIKSWYVILFAISALFLAPTSVLAQDAFPAWPASFYGAATLNGNKLPAGTKIQAFGASTLKGEVVMSEDGIYGYDNPTKQKLVVGEYTGGLSFKYVPAGMTAGLTGDSAVAYSGAFASGTSTRLDLLFTKNSPSLTATSSEAVITAADTATTTIAIAATVTSPKINFSSMAVSSATSTQATMAGAVHVEATTSFGTIGIQIPSSTVISAPLGWTGIINAPTVKSNSSVTATADSGKTSTVAAVVEVGYDDVKLVLSNAARLVLAGQAGKDAGYSRSNSFTKITATCSADTQTAGDALLAEGECKIDVGSDLVIWTKHFTSFITYTQTAIPPASSSSSSGGGGGGGGGYTPTTTSSAPAPASAVSTPPAETPVSETVTPSPAVLGETVKQVVEAELLRAGDSLTATAERMGLKRDVAKEQLFYSKYVRSLTGASVATDSSIYSALTAFVIYGTPTTKILGAGERANVLASYKATYNKLPTTQREWEDIIKIASGRWPVERVSKKEAAAKQVFKTIYRRVPNMENSRDNVAIMVMTYGLRPSVRNTKSEAAGLKIFKSVFKRLPKSVADWNILRAITYSGAKR